MAKQKVLGGASDVINNSRAGRALNRNPSLFRTLTREPTIRALVGLAMGAFVVGAVFGLIGAGLKGVLPRLLVQGIIIFGGLFILLSLVIALLIVLCWKAIKE